MAHDRVAKPVLECAGLRKTYSGEQVFQLGGAPGGLSFSVSAGELFALIGPSGCGKTTTLRIIGGFTRPDTGTVRIDGSDVTRQAPYARATNTVFQGYALFPHMSVGTNVAFGLNMAGVPRRQRESRVAETLELVGLNGFQQRRVAELSGGQQQRAALARALIRRPAVLLLDEPLGALDLELRRQMQDELVRLKTSTRTTFIHVTHDQEEACAVADRIGIMRAGNLVQVDRPVDLYRRPRDTYVAGFLDAGTIVRGRNTRSGDVALIAGPGFEVRAPITADTDPGTLAAVLPADRIRLSDPDTDGANRVTATINRLTFTGTTFMAFLTICDSLRIKARLTPEQVAGQQETMAVGATVGLHWRPEDVILVADTEPAVV